MSRTAVLPTLSEIGEGQWGMVTTAQATGQEISTTELGRLVRAGLLEPVSRGVYRLPGTAPDRLELEKAAWLRLDPGRPVWEREALDTDGGVISHRSAAAAHGIGDLTTQGVEITVPRRRTTREPGVHLRRGQLTADDTTRLDGLPVTTIERTIVDLLADHTDGGHVGDVIADAYQQNMLNVDALSGRIAPFAARYGVRGRNGSKLVDALTTQAGRGPLSTIAKARDLVQMSPELRDSIAQAATATGPMGQMVTRDLREKIVNSNVQKVLHEIVALQIQRAFADSLRQQIAAIAQPSAIDLIQEAAMKAIDVKPILAALQNVQFPEITTNAAQGLPENEKS